MPVPPGYSKERFAKLEDALAKRKGVKNRFALAQWIARRGSGKPKAKE